MKITGALIQLARCLDSDNTPLRCLRTGYLEHGDLRLARQGVELGDASSTVFCGRNRSPTRANQLVTAPCRGRASNSGFQVLRGRE